MTHDQAAQIITAAWNQVYGRDPTDNELLYTQAISLLETGYGRAGQFGKMAADGNYNWGALEGRTLADGSCPAGMVPGSDLGSVCFYAFPDDTSAAAAFIKLLTKTARWPVLQAMQGTPEDVATAMRTPPPYYTGLPGTEESKIQAYANGIRNSIRQIGANVPAPAGDPSGGGFSVWPWLFVGAIGAWYYHHEYGTPRWLSKLAKF